MINRKTALMLMLLIVFIISFVSITGCETEEAEAEAEPEAVEAEEVDEAVDEEPAVGITDITFGTATPGTTAFITGEAMASVANRELIDLGYRIMPVTSAGTLEKIRLITDQEMRVASANEDELWNAYEGLGDFAGEANKDLRLLFQAYDINYFFVTREGTGIKTLADLQGRDVNIGAPGSGSEAVARLVQQAFGLEWNEQNLAYAEGARALSDGTVEVTLPYTTGGMPGGFFVELDNTVNDLVAIPLTEEDIEKMREINPASSISHIPNDYFENDIGDDIYAYSINVQYFTQEGNLTEDGIYNMIKSIFDNQEMLGNYHVLAQFINSESALERAVDIPYHEAAIRYWEEVGVWED